MQTDSALSSPLSNRKPGGSDREADEILRYGRAGREHYEKLTDNFLNRSGTSPVPLLLCNDSALGGHQL